MSAINLSLLNVSVDFIGTYVLLIALRLTCTMKIHMYLIQCLCVYK